MRVCVDTAFTDFLDCNLISVALVADDGREFYGKRSDFNAVSCSAFVREAVLPKLGEPSGCVFTRYTLRDALLAWLNAFANKSERWLCLDYAGGLGTAVRPARWPARRLAGRRAMLASSLIPRVWRPFTTSTEDGITRSSTLARTAMLRRDNG